MAGVAGLEPVTSAVTGQRSNQLSYTPAKGDETLKNFRPIVKVWVKKSKELKIRAADAKEVGVGNPAEETYCYPNTVVLQTRNVLSIRFHPTTLRFFPQNSVPVKIFFRKNLANSL